MAVLKIDNQCKDLVVLSFYNSKPVYFISMACQKIHWIKITRKLWHKDLGEKLMFPIFDLILLMNTTMAWGTLIRLVNFTYSTRYTTRHTMKSGGGPYFSRYLIALQQMHTYCSENSTRFMNVRHHSHFTNLVRMQLLSGRS